MRTFTNVKVENFLSLKKLDLSFESLNVLVGPNGAGKTNILKIFEFLGEVARQELVPAIQQVGGMDHLVFRGRERPSARVEIELSGVITKHASLNAPDQYSLSFTRQNISSSRVARELIRRSEELRFKRYRGPGRRITLSGGRVTVGAEGPASIRQLELEIQGQATGLGTLRRLSEAYGASEWNAFAEVVEDLRLFEINVEAVRKPSRGEKSSKLKPDASNLANFLLWLADDHSSAFNALIEDVRWVLPSFQGFHFAPIGGADQAIRLDIHENNLRGTTPLGRASFGTIRAIALFAMLHDPAPPKLTCLEEIDHGLHPHALDRVVDRLRQASKRTQIIVATHSPPLVNRLRTEELVVVEKEDDGGTRAFRPDTDMIEELKSTTGHELGELWFSGILGGAI